MKNKSKKKLISKNVAYALNFLLFFFLFLDKFSSDCEYM